MGNNCPKAWKLRIVDAWSLSHHPAILKALKVVDAINRCESEVRKPNLAQMNESGEKIKIVFPKPEARRTESPVE
jgi:hypothetical protein